MKEKFERFMSDEHIGRKKAITSNPFRTPWRCADVVTVLTVRTENVLSSVVAV